MIKRDKEKVPIFQNKSPFECISIYYNGYREMVDIYTGDEKRDVSESGLVSVNAHRSICNGLPHSSSDDHNSGRMHLAGSLTCINAVRAFG